ncbi:hypothetical protein IEZ26_22735 [Nocardioides cavernae]|uniref:DUF4386 family protein n=1 Tax=Nocardioides cavernae TaxID=1921566 RepID=A0ABR8NIP4_9ACTN|nr:hypothetical protein [Nocardioides cavernae]MBD3927457.1 hypothetical protein [Nocardioides cavernae]MBM7513222.1 hypothetical protein [Nocardioides cavernae]
MRWLWGFFGLALAAGGTAALVGMAARPSRPVMVTTTDMEGNTITEERPLRRWELTLALVGFGSMAGIGALLLLGAVPVTDRRVPDERLLATSFTLVLAAMLAAGAVVSWVTAWRSRGGERPSYDVAVDPDDSVDDVATNLLTRVMLSHPASAVVLGTLLATVAAFTITQVGAVWRGDDARLAEVLQWLQPFSALGELAGLGEVSVAFILLGLGVVLALATGNGLSAVFTVALVMLFWLVALVAWPFGLLDDWLGLGRSLLSLV